MATVSLRKSDVGSALVGVLFKYAFPSYHGSMGMVAGQSLAISIVARILSTTVSIPLGSLTADQKNVIVVALLGAAVGMWGGGKNPLQASVGQTSIDLLGIELLNVLNMADGDLLGAGTVAAR